MPLLHRRSFLFVVLAAIACLASFALSPRPVAAEGAALSKGQTLYVPAYSNVFSGPRRLAFPLATTLSVRNSDLSASIRVTSIDYYDSTGKLIRRYVTQPLALGPLASTYVHVEEKDVSGGFGASFIVRWQADRSVNPAVVECVLIGATSGQGISFVSPGREISEGGK
jgi:hypothetical protein